MTNVAAARRCLADADREENSLGTRVDAAILAIAYIDKTVLADPVIADYLTRKYEQPISDAELQPYVEADFYRALRILGLSGDISTIAVDEELAGKLLSIGEQTQCHCATAKTA
jgi:hypothetical protein